MMLRLYLLYEHIYEFMQAAADSQVDIIPLVAVVSTTHHGATQPHPPEPFNFRGLDNWLRWKHRFEQFRIVSGLTADSEWACFCTALVNRQKLF